MLSITHDGITLSVDFDRHDGSRCQWNWRILGTSKLPEGIAKAPEGQEYIEHVVLAEGSDLQSPSYDMVGALRTLVGFLQAWAESVRFTDRTGRQGENADLFPASLAECVLPRDWESWCDVVAMELQAEGEG